MTSVSKKISFMGLMVPSLFLLLFSLSAAAHESHRDDIIEFNAGWVASPHGNATVWGIDYEHLNRTHSMGFALTYERESRSLCPDEAADLYAVSYIYFIDAWKLSAGLGYAHSKCLDSFLTRVGVGYEFDLKEFEDIFVIPAVFVDHVFDTFEATFTVGFGYRF